MDYIKYNRSFVMMEEQSSTFAARASVPIKGYLKVETGNNKGALRCAVQNLKFYEKGDYIYKLILFGKKGEKTIHTVIGSLLVNRQGNGETYFRFQPLDIDGKGNAYHDFSTAIVAAASNLNEKEALHPILKGATFSDNMPFQSELHSFAASVEKGQYETEEDEEDLKRLNELVNIKEDETNRDEEEAEDKAAEFKDTVAAPSVYPEKKEKKNYNGFYNQYILNACAHTCRVAEFYEDVMPFSKDKTGATWKKIVNITNLPLVSPGAHYFATQYHHYIFGAKADESGMASKFYFGIPGRFLDEEQPDGGNSGFTYWQPIRGAESLTKSAGLDEKIIRKSSYGYWIVSIDAKTGNIEEV